MVLRLKDKDFLRLRGARGMAIEVVGGRVWITEDGRQRRPLPRARAAATASAATAWCWWRRKTMKRLFACFLRLLEERRARSALYALSDGQLRDIGLRREQIEFIRLN